MAKRSKVVLFLVEGPSDESALIAPFASLWNAHGVCSGAVVESEAFFCDVTTVHLFGSEVDFTITNSVLKNVHNLIAGRIERKHTYDWKDLVRVVHIVDLDGVFVPSSCIRPGTRSGFHYGDDFIEAPDTSDVVLRNQVKAAALRRLVATSALRHGKRNIPYGVFFVSRNLEHAPYGLPRDFSEDEKERLSIAFGEKYKGDPEGFARLLRSEEVRVPGESHADTWRYAQKGTNSLKRGSNLHLLIDEFEDCDNG